MRYLLDQPEKRRAMGRAGAEQAFRDFDVRVMVNAYQRLYESLLVKFQCAPQLQSLKT
jgi:hypothetical protein